jgi:hypothetical protein
MHSSAAVSIKAVTLGAARNTVTLDRISDRPTVASGLSHHTESNSMDSFHRRRRSCAR